jgi:hypothetical protein
MGFLNETISPFVFTGKIDRQFSTYPDETIWGLPILA